ncbi:MAG: DNA repair protein RecO C-terminal domain-containing protein [Bacteroidales bacterium]|nr:DNA repair protein RecO C-terminal domain-containing protein [Bacteroidales bacterium]
MTGNTQLIVLSLTKFKDNAIVLHCLSRDQGRRSFIVNVGKGGSMAMFLPLSILEADIVENPKSQLARAHNISALHPLYSLRDNMYKNSIAMFLSEVLYRSIRDGFYEEGLFDWCQGCILTLDSLEKDFSNYHLRFLLEYAQALGFAPSLEALLPFAGDSLPQIKALLESSFSETLLLPLNGEQRNRIADALLKYIGYHSECSLNVQSLKVLREIFA